VSEKDGGCGGGDDDDDNDDDGNTLTISAFESSH
jgi:hypothetical protein